MLGMLALMLTSSPSEDDKEPGKMPQALVRKRGCKLFPKRF